MALSPKILKLDMAALLTFRLVYQRRSFAAAAGELGMNPSSISYTMDRVRKAAGDPLFVRQGGAIAPTDRCRAIMESVERILAEAENLADNYAFDPLQATAEIRIFGSAVARQLLFPSILRHLRRMAPGISLRLQYGYGGAREALLDGRADLAIIPGVITDNAIHSIQHIIPDQHFCMMDRSHPLASKKAISVEDYAGAGQIWFEPVPGWQQSPQRHALREGFELNRVVASSDAMDLGDMVEGTDLVAALPRRVAWKWRDRLALRSFDFDTPAATHMYWTAAAHRSKINEWMRSLIEHIARNLLIPETG